MTMCWIWECPIFGKTHLKTDMNPWLWRGMSSTFPVSIFHKFLQSPAFATEKKNRLPAGAAMCPSFSDYFRSFFTISLPCSPFFSNFPLFSHHFSIPPPTTPGHRGHPCGARSHLRQQGGGPGAPADRWGRRRFLNVGWRSRRWNHEEFIGKWYWYFMDFIGSPVVFIWL